MAIMMNKLVELLLTLQLISGKIDFICYNYVYHGNSWSEGSRRPTANADPHKIDCGNGTVF